MYMKSQTLTKTKAESFVFVWLSKRIAPMWFVPLYTEVFICSDLMIVSEFRNPTLVYKA
jgi:hypothetical protein